MKKWVYVLSAIIIVVLIVFFLFTNRAKDINDIKNEEFIGKTVKVSGVVKTVVKIGSLSGFVLSDDTGSIAVSSQELPKEGDTLSVKGVLIRDSLLGYYIKT